MHRKITYYKMLTPERRRNHCGGRRHRPPFPSSRCSEPIPSSLEPSYEEEEADPLFMAEVAAQKALDAYETMDADATS